MNRLQKLLERDQWAELRTDAQRIADISKNSDMEILAFNIKEAIKKASEIYGIPSNSFTISEITRGRNGMMGWLKSPSRYMVTLKPEAKDLLLPQTDYNSLNALAQNKNGSFRIIMRKTGLHLSINNPTGLGTPISLAQVEEHLSNMGIVNYDKSLVLQAFKKNGEPVVIAPYVHSSYDSTFTVYTDKDNMVAYFSYTAPKYAKDMEAGDLSIATNNAKIGRIPEAEEVIEALKKLGILYGINEKVIREILSNDLYNVPLVVAEGIVMENGEDGYIEYLFPTGQDQIKYAVMADGSVNFKELNIIHNVQKGDTLAIMHPPTPGSMGKTLMGENIPPMPGKEISFNLGENVSISGDGLRAIASDMGQVYLKNNQICVDPALEISGDVDLSVGNIDFIGNVIIKGNVDDGFTVIAGGNVEIHGHIGKSFISAEGNIISHKGIQGRDDAKIECRGNLFAKFIERASLSVGQNIVVSDYILHCSISCHGNIIAIGGKRPIIAGGQMRVQGSVYAEQAGAESYIETNIEVGYAFKAFREIAALEKVIQERTERIELMKVELANLAGHINPRTAKLEQMIFSLQEQQKKSEAMLSVFHAEVKETQDASCLSLSKRMMPGVRLRIGDATLDNTGEQGSAAFIRKDKAITASAYRTPHPTEAPPSLSKTDKRERKR
ncbi:MAG: DUF342 domain-containing protein [Brevinema sp.]